MPPCKSSPWTVAYKYSTICISPRQRWSAVRAISKMDAATLRDIRRKFYCPLNFNQPPQQPGVYIRILMRDAKIRGIRHLLLQLQKVSLSFSLLLITTAHPNVLIHFHASSFRCKGKTCIAADGSTPFRANSRQIARFKRKLITHDLAFRKREESFQKN